MPADTLAQQIRSTWGGNWDDAGYDRAQELADLLSKAGVENISDIQLQSAYRAGNNPSSYLYGDAADKAWKADQEQAQARLNDWASHQAPSSNGDDSLTPATINDYLQGEYGQQLVIGGKAVGYLGDYNKDGSYGNKSTWALTPNTNLVAWSSRGKGAINYTYGQNPTTGKLEIRPVWGGTSDWGDIRDVAKGVGLVVGAGYAYGAYAGAEAGAGAATAGGGLSSADAAALYGDAGYGAGMTGAETAGYGSTAADLASQGVGSTGGYWNGTDFSGTAPSGSSAGSGAWNGTNFGKGAAGMGLSTSDWIQLAGMGLGYLQSNNAQNSADANAAYMQGLSREMLDFTKQQYSDSLPYIKQARDLSLKSAQQQLDTQAQQNAIAQDLANYNKSTFRPLEQKIVSDAQGYDTSERRQAAADEALAANGVAAAQQREALNRSLAASGATPGSAKSLAILGSAGANDARAGAAAALQARRGIEQQGFARMMDAASLGRNLPSAQATTAATGIQAGNAAVNGATAGANSGLTAAQLVQQGYTGAGNLAGTGASLQLRADEASNALWSQLGQTAGSIGVRASDENLKTDVQPESPDQALAEVNATPVKRWRYAPAKLAAKGVKVPPGEMGDNTGPMAQDVAANMGEDVAPGGKAINLGNLIGKTMLAVQAVDSKVNRLADMIAGGQLQAQSQPEAA